MREQNDCLNMCYQAVMTNLLAHKYVQFPQTEEFGSFITNSREECSWQPLFFCVMLDRKCAAVLS